MLGRIVVLPESGEKLEKFKRLSFCKIDIKGGEHVKVLKTDDSIGFLGATRIEIDGVCFEIEENHPTSWCYFTLDMVEDHEEYGLKFLNEKSEFIIKPLEDRYNRWVVENIDVYNLFCKFTLQAINAGKKKVSHWLIVNRIRWEVEVETVGVCEQDSEYKISNDYIAFLARDFIKDYPQHSEVFNLKRMKRL